MRITCLVIGKTNEKYFIDAIDEYTSRLKHYLPFEITVIPELKNVKNVSISDQKEKEADLILKNIQSGDYIVLLDEHGKEFTSLAFSAYIEKRCTPSANGCSLSSEGHTDFLRVSTIWQTRKYHSRK